MELEKTLKGIEDGVDAVKKLQEEHGHAIQEINQRVVAVEGTVKQRGVSLPGVNEGDNKGKFSFARAIVAMTTGDWSRAQFEFDVFKETKKRDMSAGIDSAGGFAVPNEYIAEMVEMLRAKTVVLELGAMQMDNLVGSPVEIPKQTGGATAAWVAENAAISGSDLALGQITMAPHQASALTKLSNRLLRLSNPGVEALVREDLAAVLARLIDLAALRGTGASNQPLGVANTPSINEVEIATDGGEISYDVLVDMQTKLDEDNALEGRLGYLFHPLLRAKIAKLKDADGRPLFNLHDPGALLAQPGSSLIGYSWKTSTQIPVNLTKGAGTSLSEVYFANWAELIIGSWGGLQLDASREAGAAFENNQTFVRIIKEVDVAVRHPESFCLINDAKTA